MAYEEPALERLPNELVHQIMTEVIMQRDAGQKDCGRYYNPSETLYYNNPETVKSPEIVKWMYDPATMVIRCADTRTIAVDSSDIPTTGDIKVKPKITSLYLPQ